MSSVCKISVVMSTYNGEKFLEEQLNSICNQSVLPDEIIVGDDNSADNTISILEKYKKKFKNINWKIIVNNVNKGFRENFHNLINLTEGEIVFLSDQDDIWNENKIENYVSFFKEHSEATVIVGDFEYLLMPSGFKDKSAERKLNIKKDKIIFNRKNFLNARPGWTFAIKRKKILKNYNNIYYSSAELFHDEILWYIGLFTNGLYHIRCESGKWRRFSESVTSGTHKKGFDFFSEKNIRRHMRSKDLLRVEEYFGTKYNGSGISKVDFLKFLVYVNTRYCITKLLINLSKKGRF